MVDRKLFYILHSFGFETHHPQNIPAVLTCLTLHTLIDFVIVERLVAGKKQC